MQWKDLNPDINFVDIKNLFCAMNCGSAIRLQMILDQGLRLFILNSCYDKIIKHVKSDSKEIGGLLLGKVLIKKQYNANTSISVVMILDSVPSKVHKNTSVSLEMSTEIWNSANKRTTDNLIIIGWYHSHPDLGAYFSGTDRKTQRSFFNHEYSVGWVIDPIRNEQKIFTGKESTEYFYNFIYLRQSTDIIESINN